MSRVITSLILLIALLINVRPASAEREKYGRLADGRAYRVDAEGSQLVDELAELQVANDELQKQVATLEEELDSKDKMVEQYSGGPGKASAGGDVPNCNELVSGLHLKISKLQSQLKQGSGLPAAQVCDYESAQNPLWAQIRELESRIEQKSGSSSGQCNFDVEENPFRQQVRQLQQEARDRGTAAEPAEGDQRARMAAPAASTRTAALAPKAEKRSSSSPERRELQQALKNIEALILARKSAYDQLKSHGTAVTVGISPLRTATGVSLDTLRTRIQNLGQHSDPDELRQGLSEIEKILQDDIAVMRRLQKL